MPYVPHVLNPDHAGLNLLREKASKVWANFALLEFQSYEFIRILTRRDSFEGSDLGTGAEPFKPRLRRVKELLREELGEEAASRFEEAWDRALLLADDRNKVIHAPVALYTPKSGPHAGTEVAGMFDMKSSDDAVKHLIGLDDLKRLIDESAQLADDIEQLRVALIELVGE